MADNEPVMLNVEDPNRPEEDPMPKPTVASLTAEVNTQAAQIAQLEATVAQLVSADVWQSWTLVTHLRSFKDLKARVIRDAKRGSSTSSSHQTTTSPRSNRSTQAPCTVEGCNGHQWANVSDKHAAKVNASA